MGATGKQRKGKIERGGRRALGAQRWDTVEGANDGGQRVKPHKQH